jgi:hypothetical protein
MQKTTILLTVAMLLWASEFVSAMSKPKLLPKPDISLTLIPPSPITDQVILDI